MASCSLAKIQSRVRGHHICNHAFKVGEILNSGIENNNKNSENALAVFSNSKKMVCRTPEPLAKILFPLIKRWKILEIKVEVSGKK